MSTSEILFPAIRPDNQQTALVEGERQVSYAELCALADEAAYWLLGSRVDLEEERIAFFLPASVDYVRVMHGVWRAGGIAVPLNVASALSELEHYLSCARVTRLVTRAQHRAFLSDLCAALQVEILVVEELQSRDQGTLPDIDRARRALMLFTSGTTSKPKGVISTHHIIASQITMLVDAWKWCEHDRIPLFLPLHHLHGILSVLCCGLWSGARIHLFPKLDIEPLAREIAEHTYSLFMAVPTVYVKLINHIQSAGAEAADALRTGFGAMRLNVSGSAACPVPVFERWRELTGQALLERYGMTEIGMGLSNPYDGERRAGFVGQPLPGVEIRLVADDGTVQTGENQPGEIHVRSAGVFKEYWDAPEATRQSFDGPWFKTGDMAVIERGYFRIMGRTSIDIIKSGGYKLSALEIESVLLEHPDIAEIAVIGAADEVWGEAVAAFAVVDPTAGLTHEELKTWCVGRMSNYKIPRIFKQLDALPRNAMGKVTKAQLKELLSL